MDTVVRVMGERALAVCLPEKSLYYSQWGASTEILWGVLAADSPSGQFRALLHGEWRFQGQLSVPLPDEIDHLNCEGVYILSDEGVGLYLPLWFGFPRLDTTPHVSRGVLVGVSSPEELSYRRMAFHRHRSEIGDAVVAGLFDERNALWTLLHALEGPVYPSQCLLQRCAVP